MLYSAAVCAKLTQIIIVSICPLRIAIRKVLIFHENRCFGRRNLHGADGLPGVRHRRVPALRRKGHQAILVDLFMGLENPPADLNALFDAPDGLCPDVKITVHAPDLEAVRRSRPDQSPSRIGPHVLDICRLADVVFLGLHGMDGEDGRIQAALDLLGVPYTGAGYLGSAIAMDKIASKQMMDANGIPNPKWQALTYTEEEIPHLAETLPMPCVVKAPTGGSSLGCTCPRTGRSWRTRCTGAGLYGPGAGGAAGLWPGADQRRAGGPVSACGGDVPQCGEL